MRAADAKKAKNEAGPERSASRQQPGISERVLEYFERNATAMDSVEGIARFWVHEDRHVVETCLEDLHARGLLDRRLIAGTAFYSLSAGPASVRESETSSSGDAVTPRAADTAPTTDADRIGGAAPAVDAARASGAAAAASAPAPALAGAPQAAARGRLLVVDDESAVRQFLVAALVQAGHSVAEAESGERAIEMFRHDPCDVVLTDIMMPATTGMEVLRTVKRMSPATEVIVVTAYASLDTALHALRDGAYDLISKPLSDIESLYRVVDRALERRRLSLDNRLLVEKLQARNIELNEAVARLAAVNEIGKATTGLLELDELYGTLVRLVAQHLKARRVSTLVAEPDSDVMNLVASVGINDEDARHTRIRVGEGIAGKVAATQTPLLVADIEKSDLRQLKGVGKYATTSFMISPLTVAYPIRFQRKQIGVINVSDKRSGEPFNEQDMEFLSTLSSQVAVAIENARLVREMELGYLGALVELIRACEDADPETRGHSVRVATAAASVAGDLKLPQARIEALLRAAALHEVGRMALGPTPGALSSAGGVAVSAPIRSEWTADSVMAAERILAPIASLRAAREIILHSATRFDAARMPFGVERSTIPIESRILSVCEDFTRMTAAAGEDAAAALRGLEALRQEAGRKHDPNVVAALCRVVEKGERR